jgi:hypothetical protein
VSIVQSFTLRNNKRKVAINLGNVTHASPHFWFPPETRDDPDPTPTRCVEVHVAGCEIPFILATTYEDFVFAWGRAVTPQPTPILVQGGAR